ncbi:MAG TPA: hypothetical protein GXZ64_06095 [Clostridiaceae bacterium]|nr:hypothetical protein [Clostridiaceae bacterium]
MKRPDSSELMESNDAFLKSTYNRYLVPTMLSILGGSLNTFVDRILIGNFVGEDALAAVNLAMPVNLIFFTVGSLIVSGASVLSAKEAGKSNPDKSRRIFGSAILFAFTFAALLWLFGLIFLDPVVSLLGGGSLSPLFRQYVQIIMFAGLWQVLLYVPFYYLRFDGRNNHAAGVMLLYTAMNIALDILFMRGFAMGLAGAAYASLAAAATACAAGFWLLFRPDGSFSLPLVFSKPSVLRGMVKTGTPSALHNLATAFRILVINSILLAVSADSTMLVTFAVLTAVSEFSLFLQHGIPQTAMPIISVYHVEKSNDGIRLLMKREILLGLLSIIGFGAVMLAFHSSVSRLFGVTRNLLVPLLCLAASLAIGQINSIVTSFFNATGRIALANLITVSRVLFLPAVFAWLLSGSAMIWLFLPLAELATLIVWLGAAFVRSRANPPCSPLLLLDDSLVKSGRALDFSVRSTAGDICLASQRITEFCEQNDLTPKQTMQVSLAIEEIMTLMAERSIGHENGSFDVRAFATGGSIGLRIRCAGKRFNPLSLGSSPEDEDQGLIGIRMLTGMVKNLQYVTTFGVNSFFVQIQ